MDGTVFGLPVSTDMSGFGGPKASTVVTDGRDSHNKKATIDNLTGFKENSPGNMYVSMYTEVITCVPYCGAHLRMGLWT